MNWISLEISQLKKDGLSENTTNMIQPDLHKLQLSQLKEIKAFLFKKYEVIMFFELRFSNFH